MNLLALPAFDDNYIWMLHDSRSAIVVDPGDAAPVSAALERLSLELAGILVTHHHGDHVGGLEDLTALRDVPIWGPDHASIPVRVNVVGEGGRIEILGLTFDVIEVPGHTCSHLAYFAGAQTALGAQAPILFCGDTLFSGGCGRLFEGTPAQMVDSLDRLAALPGDTRVCCAHEYTLSNLRFARAVEPDNGDLARYESHCRQLRSDAQPTLPSRIDLERRINPFLRCDVSRVIASARAHDAASTGKVDVFAALRNWKNNFR